MCGDEKGFQSAPTPASAAAARQCRTRFRESTKYATASFGRRVGGPPAWDTGRPQVGAGHHHIARHQLPHLNADTVSPPRQLFQSRFRVEREVDGAEVARDVKPAGLRDPRHRGNRHRQICVSRSRVSVRPPAEWNAFRQVAIPEFNA